MHEHFTPQSYEREPDSDTSANRRTHIRRGGRVDALGALAASGFMRPEKAARRPIVELTPDQIAQNRASAEARDAQLLQEADARAAEQRTTEIGDTINIVGGRIEVGGLSADDQARVEEAARIGERFAQQPAETAPDNGENEDDGGDSLTVTSDGRVVVRGNPQIGTIVGGQVRHYPR